jgi:hypothetical protein
VGVALLAATTPHLATRGGETAEETTGPQALAPPDESRVARVTTVATRIRTPRPKAVRHARQAPSPKPSSSSSATASTRSGWSHGHKNHSHTGPGKHSQAAKHGNGHKNK